MTASRIVEALDEGEHCGSRLGLRLEPAAIEQFARGSRRSSRTWRCHRHRRPNPSRVAHLPHDSDGRTRSRCIGRIQLIVTTRSLLAYRATPETDPASPHCDTRRVHFDRRVIWRRCFRRCWWPNLDKHSADDIAAVAAALNTRPRKTLAWQTPAEALDQLLISAMSSDVQN